MIKQISIIVIGILALVTILSFFGVFEKTIITAALLSGGITLVNSFAAQILFDKSYQQSNQKFLIYNLGGMGVRLIFLLVVVFIVIKFLKIDEYEFIFLFFIFYFTSLFLEVNYFRIKAKEQGKSKV